MRNMDRKALVFRYVILGLTFAIECFGSDNLSPDAPSSSKSQKTDNKTLSQIGLGSVTIGSWYELIFHAHV
jgi:hypothetical protein